MYGDEGYKLVQHAKRTQALNQLPPYQTDTVRAVTREVRDLDRDVADILEPYAGSFDPSQDPATACALLVHHLCMRRNKRCLLAYHRVRAEKITEMCWGGIDVVEHSRAQMARHAASLGGGSGGNDAAGEDAGGGGSGMGPEGGGMGGAGATVGTLSALSPEEDEYARQYSDMLAAYKGQWTDIDLTGSLEPPRDLFIDVRVLKDAGEIQTEYGAITLSKNSQFFVRQNDVERLIKQGFLQKLG